MKTLKRVLRRVGILPSIGEEIAEAATKALPVVVNWAAMLRAEERYKRLSTELDEMGEHVEEALGDTNRTLREIQLEQDAFRPALRSLQGPMEKMTKALSDIRMEQDALRQSLKGPQ
jgi:chromosome segregation ATPase